MVGEFLKRPYRPITMATEDKVTQIMNEVQKTPNPSDIVLIETKNSYRQIGLILKQQNIPYIMRISKEPVKSYAAAGLNYWTVPRHSLLIEPVAHAMLLVQVMLAKFFNNIRNKRC